jgi:hypothetical protein
MPDHVHCFHPSEQLDLYGVNWFIAYGIVEGDLPIVAVELVDAKECDCAKKRVIHEGLELTIDDAHWHVRFEGVRAGDYDVRVTLGKTNPKYVCFPVEIRQYFLGTVEISHPQDDEKYSHLFFVAYGTARPLAPPAPVVLVKADNTQTINLTATVVAGLGWSVIKKNLSVELDTDYNFSATPNGGGNPVVRRVQFKDAHGRKQEIPN